MIVYFLRHASAGQHVMDPRKDAKRPLDKDGIEQCGYVGRALAAMDIQVDVVITSPLKRATQTASLVANEIGHEGKLQIEDGLGPAATIADFRRLLAKYDRYEAVLMVGHNPNLSEFLSRTIGGDATKSAVDLKKGAVARVDVTRRRGVLQWCVTPKLLRVVYASAAESVRPKTSRK
jgi:phosphohistidine phosphatase